MATSKRSRAAYFVVNKVLGVDVDERYTHQPDGLDKRARETLDPADIYLEDEPTVIEFLRDLRPTGAGVAQYVESLFPSATWIRKYNLRWLFGDVIAGITIGLVVVPQAMAYAALAQLPPAYGLYTSFTGAVLYWIFGTSKDIVIGTTAVGSLLVGQVVSHVNNAAPGEYQNEDIAHGLSMLSGAVLLFFGLFRLGWIIEFIPYIPISAFVTGASITIMSTQIPTALGILDINTREAPYKVLVDTVKGLPTMQLDAAIGVSSIVLLFAIRGFCSRMEVRQPHHKRVWSTLSSLRLTFTMLLFTLISYLVNRTLRFEDSRFQIVGHIDRGFQHAKVPRPDTKLLGLILPELPAISIILVIEHIAIAKAMGRLYGYTIRPSQEIVSLGAANMLSPFVGGYVCTGSFGASAVLSKAGSRTPLAGLFSAMVLILALYALTTVFYYIPKAALAGLIIHAVYNLITPPKNLHKYWQLSPIDLFIWVVGVVLAVFVSLEICIYVGMGLSIAVLLVRLARTKGRFLGTVRARTVVGEEDSRGTPTSSLTKVGDSRRDVFLPLDRQDASNPRIKIETPYPGVFVYRFSETFNYTNQAYHADTLLNYIKDSTNPIAEEHFEKESDRLWNDPGPRVNTCETKDLPHLRAIVLDCSAINNLDVTSVQGLIDLRNSLDRYAAPDAVEWHFANVHNRWSRRALAVAGFGYPTARNPTALRYWRPIYSIAAVSNAEEASHVQEVDEEQACSLKSPQLSAVDVASMRSTALKGDSKRGMAAIHGVDRPFFHVDLHEAVASAIEDAQSKDGKPHCGAY